MWNWLSDESSSFLQASSLNSHGFFSECLQKSLSLPLLISPAWISLDRDPVFMITFNLNNLLKTLLGASQKALAVKNLPANAGDVRDADLIPGFGRSPGGGKWQLTPVFLPEKFHGQRSLVGYHPWSCKESDTTEVTEHARREPRIGYTHSLAFLLFLIQRELKHFKNINWINRSLIFWCPYWIKDIGSQISVILQKYIIGEIYGKKVEKKRGYMYSYSWFTLLYSRN